AAPPHAATNCSANAPRWVNLAVLMAAQGTVAVTTACDAASWAPMNGMFAPSRCLDRVGSKGGRKLAHWSAAVGKAPVSASTVLASELTSNPFRNSFLARCSAAWQRYTHRPFARRPGALRTARGAH